MGLEQEILKREQQDKKAADRAAKLKQKQDEKQREARARYVRTQFNKLFAKLKTLVDGDWDQYGWGWKFRYKTEDFYVAYEHYFHAKYPGDVDDYDSEGDMWVLKRGFNASGTYQISLSESHDMSEQVIEGIRKLMDPDTHRTRRW